MLTKEEAQVVSAVLHSVDSDHLEFGLEFTEEDMELLYSAISKIDKLWEQPQDDVNG